MSVPAPAPGALFSVGAVLAWLIRARGTTAPWLLSAAALALLGCWDVVARDGAFDFTLLGLAAYELLVGLTEEI